MNTELTEKIACEHLQGFFQQNPSPFVLFGTGASCAVDNGFGMAALRDHLLREMSKAHLRYSQKEEWDLVVNNLKTGHDLESAMGAVQDDELIRRIVKSAARHVSSLDRQYSIKILSGLTNWPAISLLKRLVDRLPGSNAVLHVATPNYDLLAEYAFEYSDIPYLTGFCGGVCRRRDWQQAIRGLEYKEAYLLGRKQRGFLRIKKHIRLYKVHGSLNTFKLNNTIVENNAWVYNMPDSVERVMITPGTSKYKMLHQNRSELLHEYDDALQSKDAFLFIGFGFNDSQLCNDALNRKLKEQKCRGLILTKSSNHRIEEYIKECDNLWLVCGYEENGTEWSAVSNSRYSNVCRIKNKRLWDAGEFTKYILGGVI